VARDRQDFVRRGTVSLDNLRSLDRRVAKIGGLSRRIRRTVRAKPDIALVEAITLLGEYRSLIALTCSNMAGCLFIAASSASRMGKPETEEPLHTLAYKYLTHGVLQDLPEAPETFERTLQAAGVLPAPQEPSRRSASRKRRRGSAA
jgi:hypothetical protein